MACKSVVPTEVVIDQSNASASIQVTGRSFVNLAKDAYNGIQTVRPNRSRFVRVGTAYTPTYVTFDAQAIPGGTGQIGVVVDNQSFASVDIVNTDVIPRRYTVHGLPAGAKTVDLYEDFQERVDELNTGNDGKVAGCYIRRVILPYGSGGLIQKVTATNVIVLFGDSHIDGDADAQQSVNGWGGQLRRAGLANGNWLVAYGGAGSSTQCGDGLTAADAAQEIIDLFEDAEAVNPYFLMMRRPNDRLYSDFASAIHTTPTQYGTFTATMVDLVKAAWPNLQAIFTRIPQGSAQTAAVNGAGFNNADYWTATLSVQASRSAWITVHDGVTDFGLNTATCFVEGAVNGVHLNQATGHNVVGPIVCGWYGLTPV